MAKVIYPVIGKQTALPIYLAGIGISEYEYHINRRKRSNLPSDIVYIKWQRNTSYRRRNLPAF